MSIDLTQPEERQEKIEGQSDKSLSTALEAEVFSTLSKQEQDEFYKTCRKLKIDKYDTELFRIMSLFQYQKRYLEDLPAEIEKHKKELEKHRAEIVTLSEQAAGGANAIEKHLETITALSAQAEDPIMKVRKSASDVVTTTANNLNRIMRDNLKEMEVEVGETMKGMSDNVNANLNNIFVNVRETFEKDIQKSLDINHMDLINQSVVEVVASRAKTAKKIKKDNDILNKELDAIRTLRKEYRADVIAIKWANWRWCSASMIVIIVCSWFFFYLHYKSRLNETRDAIVRQVGENQSILSTLAKANRRLEFTNLENGNKMLLIRNSKGWTTLENHGVIEFK